MPNITLSSAVGRAAAFAVALLCVALIAWCSRSSSKYRPMTQADHCMGMPVSAGPTGPLIGYLLGGAVVDPGTGPVEAINVSVVVDGQIRSVWRRQSDVVKWYVPVHAISPKDCTWTSPGLTGGTWQPTRLEFGLDAPLWHRLFGGWTAHYGFLTSRRPI
jgi:hypothetical protein